MTIIKYLTILCLTMLCTVPAYPQQRQTEVCIDFRVNSTVIDTTYMDNAVRMRELTDFLRAVRQDSTVLLLGVTYRGAASPEDSYQTNRSLARGRIAALEELVGNEIAVPDSIVTRDDHYIPWKTLKTRIMNSRLSRKEEIAAILEEDSLLVDYHRNGEQVDSRFMKIKQLDGGRVWEQMDKLFFHDLRHACVVIQTCKEEPRQSAPEPKAEPDIAEKEPVAEAADTLQLGDTIPEQAGEGFRNIHIKTNLAGLAMGIANVAAEMDLARHWSFSLPVYYSAWNYFTSTVKFRTFALQPELRYWPSDANCGFFAGGHFGMAYYNLAFGGDYRYQDHRRETPALGGGISVGYRMPLSRNGRWKVEFSVGAGGYRLHYDKFHNTPDTKQGLLAGDVRKTYWGVDQASVSVAYAFPTDRKGGRR